MKTNHSNSEQVNPSQGRIFLNGQEYPYEGKENETILEFIKRHLGEEKVPHLCYHPKLQPAGSCRLCAVDVSFSKEGSKKVMASCHTPLQNHMHIETHSERIVRLRSSIINLMKQELNRKVDLKNFSGGDVSHPYIKAQFSDCIYCYRCVRACDEIQGQFVLGAFQRGYRTQINKGNAVSFAEAGCVSCGMCVQLCPTEALTHRETGMRSHQVGTHQQDVVITTCVYCGVGCQLEVHKTKDLSLSPQQVERITEIEALDHLCVKGRYAFEFYNHPERLKVPLIRTKNSEFKEVSWEEAYQEVITHLVRIKNQFGPDALAGISSARATNEENYLMQKLFREVIGTNNIDGCARVCHAPTAYGMQKTLGTGAATNSFDDLEFADCILVVGSNPTEAHPVVGAQIKQQVLKGKNLIVIDPRRTELARLADIYLQVRPGGNIPLLSLLGYFLLEYELIDLKFINERTENFIQFKSYLQSLNHTQKREEYLEACGVPIEMIQSAARMYGKLGRRAMCFHGLGVTEHYQGSHTVMLLSCLAMMTGQLGKRGVGINPLRGQNNVQGLADMGVQPHQGPGYLPLTSPPGLKIPEMIMAAETQQLKFLWIVGEDILQTDPHTTHVRSALSHLEFLVVQELFMTETASMANVVFPVACFFEKEGTFTNGERRVQRVQRVLTPSPPLPSDGEVLAEVMTRLNFPTVFNAREILAEISEKVPIYQGINWESLERAEKKGERGLQWPLKRVAPNSQGGLLQQPLGGKGENIEWEGTAFLHEKYFMKEGGKAQFYSFEWKPSPELENLKNGYPLILTTGRVLEHYNCGSMTRRTPNVQLVEEDLLLISNEDALKYSIQSGTQVHVESQRGETYLKAWISDEVPCGILFTTFHFPQGAINQLTGCIGDLETMTPEYKLIAVRISSSGSTHQNKKTHRDSMGLLVV